MRYRCNVFEICELEKRRINKDNNDVALLYSIVFEHLL